MANRNRINGNRFESELCELLAKHGYWVHNMAQNKAGQPTDIIAVKHGLALLIDAKLCKDDVFSFERVEDNQRGSMMMWLEKVRNPAFFACKVSTGRIYVVTLDAIDIALAEGIHSIRGRDWLQFDTLERFLGGYD